MKKNNVATFDKTVSEILFNEVSYSVEFVKEVSKLKKQ